MDTGFAPLALEDMPQSLQEVLRPISERVGYLGRFFQYTGHAPGVLKQFMAYTSELRSIIPPDINELIALTVCARLNFVYERNQHEQLASRLGLSRDWIASLTNRQSLASLPESHRNVHALVLAVLDDDISAARGNLIPFISQVGPEIAMAALFQITRFSAICSLGSLLSVEPQANSIFDESEDVPNNDE